MMKILGDLLSTLNTEASVRDIRQGLFHTAVMTRNCGLAATLPRDALQQEQPLVKEPGRPADNVKTEPGGSPDFSDERGAGSQVGSRGSCQD